MGRRAHNYDARHHLFNSLYTKETLNTLLEIAEDAYGPAQLLKGSLSLGSCILLSSQ